MLQSILKSKRNVSLHTHVRDPFSLFPPTPPSPSLAVCEHCARARACLWCAYLMVSTDAASHQHNVPFLVDFATERTRERHTALAACLPQNSLSVHKIKIQNEGSCVDYSGCAFTSERHYTNAPCTFDHAITRTHPH